MQRLARLHVGGAMPSVVGVIGDSSRSGYSRALRVVWRFSPYIPAKAKIVPFVPPKNKWPVARGATGHW